MHEDDESEPIPVYDGYNTTTAQEEEETTPVPVMTTTSSLPKTGDSANADLMLIVFVASAASLVTMLVMNAKKDGKTKRSSRVTAKAKHDCSRTWEDLMATWEDVSSRHKKGLSTVSEYEPADNSLAMVEIPFEATPVKQFADEPGTLKLHPVFRE